MSPLIRTRAFPGCDHALARAREALGIPPAVHVHVHCHDGGLLIERIYCGARRKRLRYVNEWLINETRCICHFCGSREGIARPTRGLWLVPLLTYCDECHDDLFAGPGHF